MWFTPCSSRTSSVLSASAWETDPSAAAPKIVRVLSWPVLPNGAVAITVLPYLLIEAGEGARYGHRAPRARVPNYCACAAVRLVAHANAARPPAAHVKPAPAVAPMAASTQLKPSCVLVTVIVGQA